MNATALHLPERRGLSRWTLAAITILMVHAAIVAAIAWWYARRPVEPNILPAIAVTLAPVESSSPKSRTRTSRSDRPCSRRRPRRRSRPRSRRSRSSGWSSRHRRRSRPRSRCRRTSRRRWRSRSRSCNRPRRNARAAEERPHRTVLRGRLERLQRAGVRTSAKIQALSVGRARGVRRRDGAICAEPRGRCDR